MAEEQGAVDAVVFEMKTCDWLGCEAKAIWMNRFVDYLNRSKTLHYCQSHRRSMRRLGFPLFKGKWTKLK